VRVRAHAFDGFLQWSVGQGAPHRNRQAWRGGL